MHMTEDQNHFSFKTKFDLTFLLGIKAKNVSELLQNIKTIPPSSIYYHTHRFLQQHHFLSPEPPNDFAYWVTEVLSEATLGERLSSIDIIQFRKKEELRAKLVEIIDSYLSSSNRHVDAPEGQEFYFMASKTFLLPTPYVAHTLTDFRNSLKLVSVQSLYYHVFDSSLRLEQGDNDLTLFFKRLGQMQLAEDLARLDPYSQTLAGLKQKIIRLVEKYDKP